MHIPPIISIEDALFVFWNFNELGNKELRMLFGKLSTARISALKKTVKAEMNNRGIHSYAAYSINTKIAFEVFGLDAIDLEERRKKLKDLGL